MILAFETSCDETSVAIVKDGHVLSNVVSSQAIHAEYGGVVPELAAREHLRNLRPVAAEAMRIANVQCADVQAVGATAGPGLPGALMVGLRAAQAFAFVCRKPFYPIHHHEAHLFSPWITGEPPRANFEAFKPNVSLIVSGGHTMLVRVDAEGEFSMLGTTIDDAAGECFDKAGKLLGLEYPAGPIIDRLAKRGNSSAFDFPRPLLKDSSHDFSFSGLKTSIRYFLRDHPEIAGSNDALADLCASIQAAIVEILVTKTVRAALKLGFRSVTASGGVTCNSSFRDRLSTACNQHGLELRLAQARFCTDNAAMIGVVAERKWMRGVSPGSLNEDIKPGWDLAALANQAFLTAR